jgi:hypothetical protein
MLIASIPVKFKQVWASGASAPYVAPPPFPSQIGITPGRASFTDGFPPLNFAPVASGGIPPYGEDTNGIIQWLTQWSQWGQAGGPIEYDSTFQTNVSGYPQYAVVMSAANPGTWWMSTTDANTTNPDTGGAGWVSLAAQLSPAAGVWQTISGATGATTSGTFQATGASMTVTKKRATNKVIYIGTASVSSDAIGSPNGMLAEGRLAYNPGSGFVAMSGVNVAGANSGGSLGVKDVITIIGADNGSLPQSYGARVEYCSQDGNNVNLASSALFGLEIWG